MIATTLTAPFTVPLQVSFFAALMLGLPFYLYHLWAFIAPALYQGEKKLLFPLVALSLFLFVVGIVFAYMVFLPLAFKFLLTLVPGSVTVMTDMGAYLDFVLKFFLAFGVSFQVPVVVVLVLKSGVISRKTLTQKRPYVIVAAFTLGMLLTPPDVLSQILLAIPLWGLFELGLLLSKLKFFGVTNERYENDFHG